MADTEPRIYDISEYRPAPATKHVHHGRTAASWAGSAIALVGFAVAAIGLLTWNWTVFWVAVGLIAVALIVTIVLRKMGMGAD